MLKTKVVKCWYIKTSWGPSRPPVTEVSISKDNTNTTPLNPILQNLVQMQPMMPCWTPAVKANMHESSLKLDSIWSGLPSQSAHPNSRPISPKLYHVPVTWFNETISSHHISWL